MDSTHLPLLVLLFSWGLGYSGAASQLKVKKVDPMVDQNVKDHHTERFHMVKERGLMVLRRAQAFQIKVTFNRAPVKADNIYLLVAYGDVHSLLNGTLQLIPVVEKQKVKHNSRWKATLKKSKKPQATINIYIDRTAPVGKWDTKLVVSKGKKRLSALSYNEGTITDIRTFHLLFNPWSNDDLVYMESGADKAEYVLNDEAMIWKQDGMEQNTKIHWNLDIYGESVLEAALYLIEKTELKAHHYSLPSVVVRQLSAWINTNNGNANKSEENGVLWPNWDDPLPKDGKNPNEWIGSGAILREFMKTKEPVKYAQCFVLAGVFGTVLRAIGVPMRIVTNYDSAHDRDGSLTIDYLIPFWEPHEDPDNPRFMEDNEIQYHGIKYYADSVWNYHVWNEVYMRRPDLRSEYDGWQAVDATPQIQTAYLT